jgi:hypothetical protein
MFCLLLVDLYEFNSFAFAAVNSSSVSAPLALRSASFWSSTVTSGSAAGGGAGADCCCGGCS